ncbi:MAG: N-(5'-phosphoribosyl)anthranilate isomerase [Candidatus Heimdallarchaeota archaeon LC_2]|nr:MAG: N-(5'-phosphoribosyl)anthranilate isomerase [Candidatus Heimdallarchaeota archaeon LC_2]
MYKPRVKICCISSIDEANLAISYGASAVGLVSKMPSGPGVIPEEMITKIASIIPPGVSSFLLTSNQDVESIVGQQNRTGVNTIQIVDTLLNGTHQELKDALPGISIVQVIHVNGPNSINEAMRLSPFVDGILLDSGKQSLKIKELGGTGRTHDWTLSRKIVQNVKIPVFLAGGLKPENVSEAIKQVRPYGLDLCSGVRTNGKLDEEKLLNFINEVNISSSV